MSVDWLRLSRLSDVRLCALVLDGSDPDADPDYIGFSRLIGDAMVLRTVTAYKGREQVIAGLNELLSVPLKVKT